LPRHASKINKINDLELARSNRVYQSCALKSSRAERVIERLVSDLCRDRSHGRQNAPPYHQIRKSRDLARFSFPQLCCAVRGVTQQLPSAITSPVAMSGFTSAPDIPADRKLGSKRAIGRRRVEIRYSFVKLVWQYECALHQALLTLQLAGSHGVHARECRSRLSRSTDNKLPMKRFVRNPRLRCSLRSKKARQGSHGSSIHSYRRDTAR
jgi:hypothetical protein